MSDLSNKAAEIRERWENNQESPSSTLSEEEAVNMGILDSEDNNDNNTPSVNPTQESEPSEYMDAPEEKEYKQLNAWDTTKDVAKSVGVEALHFFQPKSRETQYESQTHFGENMKYTYRYGAGTLAFVSSFLYGGGEVALLGAGVRGLTMLPKAAAVGNGLIKLGQGIQKLNQAGRIIKPLSAGLKAARAGKSAKKAMIGAEIVNGMFEGSLAAGLADFTFFRPEENEGNFADLFPDNTPLISLLQTDENDGAFKARLKHAVDGFFVGIPFGAAIGGTVATAALQPAVRRWLKGLHKAVRATEAKEAAEGLMESNAAQLPINNITKTMDMVSEVDKAITRANETGEEISQVIIDSFPADKIDEARAMAKLRAEGEEIFPYEDGTWSIAVKKYDDAYKVTPEQYKYQLNYQDPEGNLAIQHMDNAVEDTWKQRGLVNGEGLRSSESSERNSTTQRIVDYYKDKWDLGKNKITVKYGKWSNIPDGKTTHFKNGNIVIQMNTNSPDIYASLRGELEHARDYIKGEVPAKADIKGSGEHFARYIGDNEAEVASQYTYKKSKGKAEAIDLEQYKPISKKELDNYTISGHKNTDFGENPDIVEADYEPYSIYNIKNNEGKLLAHIKITRGNYIAWRYNNSREKGVARKLIAKLLYENKYQSLVWDATTKESVKSYKRFCKEFPDLVDRIQYTDKFTKAIDNNNSVNYNQATGGITDGKEGNDISNLRGNKQGMGEDRSLDISENGENIQGTSRNPHEVTETGDTAKSNSTINERGKNTSIDSQGQQLKLDFSQATPESLGASIVKGDINLSDTKSIDDMVAHILDTDPEISGKTFQDVLNDADSYYNKALKNDPMKAAAYLSAQTPEELDRIARQQLATIKLISVLKDIQTTANPRENLRILSAVKQLDKYVEGVGSGFGRGLRYQALTKKALEMFGSEKYSDLALQGLNDLADILDTHSLNFTRNTSLKDFKASILKKIQDSPYYNTLMGDRVLFSKMDEVLNTKYNALKNGKEVDSAETIMEILNRDEAEACGWYAKLAKNTEGFVNTIKYWKGVAFRNVYTNVLGAVSVINQTVGTSVMTVAHPTYKVIGSLLSPVTDALNPFIAKKTGLAEAKELTSEAIDEAINKITSLHEALSFGIRAFIKGDGILTNTKTITENGLEGFSPFVKAFDRDSIIQNCKNLWEVFPRLLMAEDEFFNQLNYRSIVRSKALAQARREASIGAKVDITKRADDIFNQIAFNADGKPLDFQAYNEAKELTFQTPLSREQFNPSTGKIEPIGATQSEIAKGGQAIQYMVEKLPLLKPFNLFIKTPTNIADYATDSVPLFNLLKKDVRDRFTSSDPMVRAKMVGQTAVIGMIGLYGFFEAAKGNITGSEPPDRKTKTALLKTGWKPYSIRVGNKWIPYMGKIPAFDSVLALAADCMALNNDISNPAIQLGWGEISNRVFASVINNFLDQTSYRTGAEKVLDIFNPETDVSRKEKILATLGQQFLPQSSNVKTLRTLGKHDKTKAEGFYPTLVQNYTDLFVSPQDYQRDVFGDRVDYYGLLIAKATDDKFMQPEYAEMARLARRGYTPSNIANKLKKTGVALEEFKSVENGRSATDAMYEELSQLKLGGKTLQQAVAALIATPRYNAVNDGINSNGEDWSQVPYQTKTKLLNDVFQRYYTAAKNRVISKRSNEFLDSEGRTMRERQKDVRTNMMKEAINHGLNHDISNQIIRIGQ